MQMAGGAENKLTDVLAQPPIPACQGDAQSNIQLRATSNFVLQIFFAQHSTSIRSMGPIVTYSILDMVENTTIEHLREKNPMLFLGWGGLNFQFLLLS